MLDCDVNSRSYYEAVRKRNRGRLGKAPGAHAQATSQHLEPQRRGCPSAEDAPQPGEGRAVTGGGDRETPPRLASMSGSSGVTESV